MTWMLVTGSWLNVWAFDKDDPMSKYMRKYSNFKGATTFKYLPRANVHILPSPKIGMCSPLNLISLRRALSSSMSTPVAKVDSAGVPGVFKSLPSILSVLEKHSKEHEVVELLDIYGREAKTVPERNGSEHPLIVFEGLDGSGKSLLTKLTAKKLKGVKSSTPPECIQHLRPHFDKEGVDRVLRRAFYSLGNYLAAYKIQKLLESTPVVMDRFWHSTAAYALAEFTDSNDIPENTFDWPSDLLQPDLVVFLTVSENVRLKRMSTRKNFTAEEDQLKENSSYRQRLTDTFAKMKSPSLEFVNCDGVPDGIVKNVLTLLEEKVGTSKKP